MAPPGGRRGVGEALLNTTGPDAGDGGAAFRWWDLCWTEDSRTGDARWSATGHEYFVTEEAAARALAENRSSQPHLRWELREAVVSRQPWLFMPNYPELGSFLRLVMRTLIRYFGGICDTFTVHHWGNWSPFSSPESSEFRQETLLARLAREGEWVTSHVHPEARAVSGPLNARALDIILEGEWFEITFCRAGVCLFSLR